MRTCLSCRLQNRDTAKFCANCGARFKETPEAVAPEASGQTERQWSGLVLGAAALAGLAGLAWWLGMPDKKPPPTLVEMPPATPAPAPVPRKGMNYRPVGGGTLLGVKREPLRTIKAEPGRASAQEQKTAAAVCAPDYFERIEKWKGEGLGCEEGFSSLKFLVPAKVSPGRTVRANVMFRRCDGKCNPNALLYSSFLGDWQPESPLMMRDSYYLGCGGRSVDKTAFTAPTRPGTYRIRWTLCMAYAGIKRFCGDGPQGPAVSPGVCPYLEKTFVVVKGR